jgi:hypothetical protein
MKKILILFVTKHIGEIDYLLPIISQLKNKFKIIIIFREKKIYNSLVNDKILFKVLRKHINFFFVLSKKYNFVSKILYFFLKKFFPYNSFIINRLLNNIQNYNYFFLESNINEKLIAAIFIAFSSQHSIPNYLKKINKKIKVIRMQETTTLSVNPFKLKKNFIVNRRYAGYERLVYDNYLFASKDDAYQYLGKVVDKINKEIIYTGYPKFNKNWISQFLPSNKIKSFKILVSTRGYGVELSKDSFKFIVNSILKSCEGLKNVMVYFKPHPHLTEVNLLKELTKKYKVKSKISYLNSTYLINLANICVDMKTSLIFEAAFFRKKRIQFYLEKDMKLEANFPYNTRQKRYFTPAEYYKVSKNIASEYDIKKYISENYTKFTKNTKAFDLEKESIFMNKKFKKKNFLNKINYILK